MRRMSLLQSALRLLRRAPIRPRAGPREPRRAEDRRPLRRTTQRGPCGSCSSFSGSGDRTRRAWWRRPSSWSAPGSRRPPPRAHPAPLPRATSSTRSRGSTGARRRACTSMPRPASSTTRPAGSGATATLAAGASCPGRAARARPRSPPLRPRGRDRSCRGPESDPGTGQDPAPPLQGTPRKLSFWDNLPGQREGEGGGGGSRRNRKGRMKEGRGFREGSRPREGGSRGGLERK
mmetsp:Transcript_36864/g.87603  ORF Transcript_36864/g.87603 Transcript_36864/m.87603 type:complete len:234 (-) Transcript_36864:87-788(-)